MGKKKIQKRKKKKVGKKKRAKTKSLTPYEIMDLVDENQIINNIEGRIPEAAEKMVYRFIDKETNREVVGLSWTGTKEVWRELNKRKIAQITPTDKALISQGDGYVDVMVYVYDQKRKIGAWGGARGYNEMKLKSGEMVRDKFPSAKAVSKAQRNAINQLFPAEKVAKMISAWIKKGQVVNLTPQLKAPVRENKVEGLFASPEDKAKIMRVALELGGRGEKIDRFIEKKTGLRVNWKNMTKVQVSKILFELMQKRAKK